LDRVVSTVNELERLVMTLNNYLFPVQLDSVSQHGLPSVHTAPTRLAPPRDAKGIPLTLHALNETSAKASYTDGEAFFMPLSGLGLNPIQL